jgi:hypothetical protein
VNGEETTTSQTGRRKRDDETGLTVQARKRIGYA